MISLRQHAISIAAIFLALAVGVVLGSTALSDSVLSGLGSEKKELQQEVRDLEAENSRQTDQLDSAGAFDDAMAGRIIDGALDQRPVVLFTTPSAAPGDVDEVVEMIDRSGGSISGRVGLTEAFVESSGTDQLRGAVTNVVPAGVELSTASTDSGSMAGDLIGAVLLLDRETVEQQSTPEERELALQTLRSGGFIEYQDGAVAPGQVAVVVTGGEEGEDANHGAVVARFAGGLDARGAGTVLAGATGSAEGNGALAVVRNDPALAARLSTVDNIEYPAGRITTVLALAAELDDRTGQYGTGPGATAVTVE